MNLKPLGDRVIVKQAEAEKQTKSGLILADTAKEKPQKGNVIAVGEGKWDEDGEKRIAAGRQGRRHRHLQQVRRDRGQDRGRGVHDPSRRATSTRSSRTRRSPSIAPFP